jgi:hypothetical protein
MGDVASIVQAPTELDLQGIQGDQFNLTIDVTLLDGDGDPIDWSAVTGVTALVTGLTSYVDEVIPIAALAPDATNGGGSSNQGVIEVEWSADKTADFAAYESTNWSLSISFGGDGAFAVLAGQISMNPSTTPGSASSSSLANLTVVTDGVTVELAVTLGGSGAAAPGDPGYVFVYVGGGVEIDTPMVFIVPGRVSGLQPSVPFYGSDMVPLQVIGEGELFDVFFDSNLTAAADAWDTVDLSGELVVWDQAGSNLLLANFSVSGINSGTGTDQSAKLTQIQVIGTDLSIVDPGVVQSAAGGSYNILLRAEVSWD